MRSIVFYHCKIRGGAEDMNRNDDHLECYRCGQCNIEYEAMQAVVDIARDYGFRASTFYPRLAEALKALDAAQGEKEG